MRSNGDQQVAELLEKNGIEFKTYKDHVIFEGDEVLKDDGTPYTVFTPYSRKWKAKLETKIDEDTGQSFFFRSYPCEKYYDNFHKTAALSIPSLDHMGF